MHSLIRLIERVVTVVGIGAAMLLVPLVLVTCYEVFARYLFGAPTIWVYEIGYTLTGSHFLLGMAFTLKYGDRAVWECPFVEPSTGPYSCWLFFSTPREPVEGE